MEDKTKTSVIKNQRRIWGILCNNSKLGQKEHNNYHCEI